MTIGVLRENLIGPQSSGVWALQGSFFGAEILSGTASGVPEVRAVLAADQLVRADLPPEVPARGPAP
eukprot:974810-Pyramimonas_sp.AAC.1